MRVIVRLGNKKTRDFSLTHSLVSKYITTYSKPHAQINLLV